MVEEIMSRKLQKLYDKYGKEQVERMIILDYDLNNFYSKKEVKIIDLDLSLSSLDLPKKMAKDLNISVDAVIGVALEEYVKTTYA